MAYVWRARLGSNQQPLPSEARCDGAGLLRIERAHRAEAVSANRFHRSRVSVRREIDLRRTSGCCALPRCHLIVGKAKMLHMVSSRLALGMR